MISVQNETKDGWMEAIVSDKCIFYNPKTTKCHYVSDCSKMNTDLCGSKEKHEFGKDDQEKKQELLKCK